MAEEPTLEQTKQLQRNLTEKVLDRAASDPEWRQRLLDDSEAAMREAGFPEAERLAEIHQGARPQPPEGEEVRGQSWPGGGGGGGWGGYCPWYCYWYTYYWDRPWWSWYGGGGGGGPW